MARVGELAPGGAGVRGRAASWLSLGEASRLLGITPNTLRRWVDRGQIAGFVTPGGHRRFSRSAVLALLPSERRRRPALGPLVGTGRRMARAYRSSLPEQREGEAPPWLAQLSAEQREQFRERGRRMVACLVAHLDGGTSGRARAALVGAERHALEYGAASAGLGAPLGEAIEAFVRFRTPFVVELAAVARRRGLDTREATCLLVEAESALDRLLLACMAGWTRG